MCELGTVFLSSFCHSNIFMRSFFRLDMPEILWKSYIDFEIEQDESDRARDLYKRLLSKTQHVKVWMSYAQFELSVAHEDRIEQARHVYEAVSYTHLTLPTTPYV